MFALNDISFFSSISNESGLYLNANYFLQAKMVILISIITAFFIATISQKILYIKSKKLKRFWTFLGGVCFGFGIWLMYLLDGLSCGALCASRFNDWSNVFSIAPSILLAYYLLG